MARRRNPFAVPLSDTKRNEIIELLRHEVDAELVARDTIIGHGGDLDYYQTLYEGGDRKLTKNFPWPGAANLTSYLGTESVDATRARIVQTIFSDPIWVVEGFGDAAPRAPIVEEFHQWKAEEERLQGYLTRVIHTSLLEGTGVLEVSERPLKRRIKQKQRVAVQTDPLTGGVMVDERNQPIPMRDESGELVLSTDDQMASADIITDDFTTLRDGPQYRVLSLRDFLYLPGTARDRTDVWGHAKRVWKRVGDLQALAVEGIYDRKAVAELDDHDEREAYFQETRRGQQVSVRKPGPFSEKPIWEVSLLLDLDGDGIEEWYVATIHKEKGVLLRLDRDDLNMSRFLGFTPFPRPDSPYGYTLIEKIVSIVEEHTSIRNAMADRSTLVNAAPITRVHGSPWNPFLVPWGPLAILDVRDHNEIKTVQIADVPGSMVERERSAIAAKERVMGLSDSSLGVHPQVDRTLGEVQLVNVQSAVRVDEIVKNIQETMEDLFTIRHTIWKRKLRERGAERLPQSSLVGIEQRGMTLPTGLVTAELLEGTFRGKPRGSVETADLTRMRADFNGFLQSMAQLAQSSPMIGQVLGMPEVIRMIMTQAMRVFRWQDRHSLNVALARVEAAIAQAANQPQLPPQTVDGEVVEGQPMPQIPAQAGGTFDGALPNF